MHTTTLFLDDVDSTKSLPAHRIVEFSTKHLILEIAVTVEHEQSAAA